MTENNTAELNLVAFCEKNEYKFITDLGNYFNEQFQSLCCSLCSVYERVSPAIQLCNSVITQFISLYTVVQK